MFVNADDMLLLLKKKIFPLWAWPIMTPYL